MTKTLNIACLPYDRVRPLQDGRVSIDGYKLDFRNVGPADIPAACFQRGELDIGEVSPVNLAIQIEAGSHDFVGMPVFLSRAFRHSAIYIAADSKIRKPSDLQSARIGLAGWQGTTVVWQRGTLQDEYGLDLRKITWVIAPEKAGGSCGAAPKTATDKFQIETRGKETGLADLLKAGEVDAIMTLWPPAGFPEDGSIKRLFSDAHAEEVGYFRKTGHLPILHIVTVKRAVLDQDPALAKALFRAFGSAKDHALAEIRNYAFQFASLPWMHHNFEETVAVMGPDYWSYGRARNDKTMDVFMRYCHEQGVTGRKISVDEMFPVPFE